MINTLYGLDALGTTWAFFISLLIGAGFGYALERAGFSSSRRLAGIFYFTDMSVLKVMFSALVTAMLGLSYLLAAGWFSMDQMFLMPTIYGAQIAGGLLFGVGFVMGAWCPGTAAAGLAAGRIDALVFLAGTIGGSMLFNEVFPVIGSLYTAGNSGVQMVYDTLGMSRNAFVMSMTVAAVVAFWLAEWAEKARTSRSEYLGTPFLKAFSLALIVVAGGLFLLKPVPAAPVGAAAADEKALMADIENARDHIEPEELADRLISGDPDLVVVDMRPASEFEAFHIRGAVNVLPGDLAESLRKHRNKGLIVLYSNGMTHPAQARDSLQRQGFANVYILTDGLQGFRDRCLKPVSLRPEPLSPGMAARVNAWRTFFSAREPAASVPAAAIPGGAQAVLPRVVEAGLLAGQIGAPDLKIIDLRPQPEYNTAHIPGSLSINVESLRGNIGGVPSMLLPSAMLAAQFSLLGLQPADRVVLVAGDKFHDATLAAMALERMGHRNYSVLNGSYAGWSEAGHPVDAALPAVTATTYPHRNGADSFTVDYRAVMSSLGKAGTVIIDVRPADFYSGKKSDEARAGHIPGALNRPYTEDVVTASNKVVTLKSSGVLSAAYAAMIPSKETDVIVHCRTGHQASQTYFVLTHILGYRRVRWYDAGWTEWAARGELPIVTETSRKTAAK